jgi:hypothetical protein
MREPARVRDQVTRRDDEVRPAPRRPLDCLLHGQRAERRHAEVEVG